MVLKNCLKISYKGLTKNIVCDAVLHYEDVVSKVMETFDLTDVHHSAVQIYDEHGSKFDKEVFEYFLLLFPNPKKLFFVRLDTSKLINMSVNGYNNNHQVDEQRNAFSVSKSMNIMKDTTTSSNANSESVPVRRQNCFLGQWPSDTPSVLPPNQHQQNNIVQGIVNKIKMLQESHLKRKTLSTTPTIVKRSMRI